jgi:hypothetical protein
MTMPSPRRRAKGIRGPLTEPEIRELLAGHPVSCFPTVDAFLAGRRRLLAEQEEWDAITWWQYGFHPDGSPLAGPTLEGEELRDLARAVLKGAPE